MGGECHDWVQGLVVMSGELEAAYRSISMAKVPDLWARVSYPSLKPLPSYLEDLYARLAMLQVPSRSACPHCIALTQHHASLAALPALPGRACLCRRILCHAQQHESPMGFK